MSKRDRDYSNLRSTLFELHENIDKIIIDVEFSDHTLTGESDSDATNKEFNRIKSSLHKLSKRVKKLHKSTLYEVK